jgi:hypothetical protein
MRADGSRPSDRTLRQAEQAKPERVFVSNEFELFVNRVVRRHISQQLLEEADHPVLVKEDKLIRESSSAIKKHLKATENEWGGLAFRLRKISIIKHLRELAQARMKDHVETQDLDEDIAKRALESIHKEDFESLFPKSWVDG